MRSIFNYYYRSFCIFIVLFGVVIPTDDFIETAEWLTVLLLNVKPATCGERDTINPD